MWWKFQQDFFSLFNRTNDHFYPIDGLRAIASLLIILCHLVTIFNTFIPSYPHSKWEEFLKSTAFTLSPLMAYALEIFFMLSGFLLTYKLINQWKKNKVNHQLFLQQYPILILKRAFRFWPGILLSILLMFICGEPQYPNSNYLFQSFRHLSVWMFFQNYIDTEYWLASLAPLWSISLDMQVHIILPVLLYLFYSSRRFISIYYLLVILFISSIILSIIIFNPITMPIILITRRYHNLPLLLPAHYFIWLERTYNLRFQFQTLQSNPIKIFLHKMYLPLEARFGSFIAGAILAVKLINTPSEDNQNGKFKKFIFLGLIFLYVLSPVVVNVDTLLPNFGLIVTLSIASSRQIFALTQAFILFTTLCPTTHPYHSPRIKRFLSLSIWIPISKLSYLVYVIHWRISFELIFGGSLMFLTTYSITSAIFISLPIVLFISQFISCIWYIIIEKPIERELFAYLNSDKIYKTHVT
jgi:peptidoglycan/LPS O-acetylase OafA/YrhL